MSGRTLSGLRWARMGDVRVVLYESDDAGGLVEVEESVGGWRRARLGEVTYGVVIELAREAARVPPRAGQEVGDG
jgi:hypothetical protein